MQEQMLITFLQSLQQEIVQAFELLEPEHRFQKTAWDHPSGGGGHMRVLRGNVFEKAAVNWSGVYGEHFPMSDAEGPFFATGVSLITHMVNPHMPTVHMNIRYIRTEKRSWIGGGYDLTPMGFYYEEDREHFHKIAKDTLSPFGEGIYERFALQAKEYFFLPHRNKERGAGGIFFDHHHTGCFQEDFALLKAVGNSLLPAILPIYAKRLHTPFTPQDRETQNRYRAHYAEFNLVYDRGTRFGFLSKGNTEAILCSLPPSASW
ncbi:MAG: oxygen-dependent coproporphyrinogen oxidase [Chlamydiae bacterium]|nr:oxygen-dependent coproporphyrinogen oxidase [Chlamydiota bacterium]